VRKLSGNEGNPEVGIGGARTGPRWPMLELALGLQWRAELCSSGSRPRAGGGRHRGSEGEREQEKGVLLLLEGIGARGRGAAFGRPWHGVRRGWPPRGRVGEGRKTMTGAVDLVYRPGAANGWGREESGEGESMDRVYATRECGTHWTARSNFSGGNPMASVQVGPACHRDKQRENARNCKIPV